MYKHMNAARVFGPRALTRFDILGIRTVEGEEGAGTNPPAPPATPPAEPAPPAAPPAPTPQPPAPQPVQYKGNPDDYVRELREESKAHRIAAEKAAADYAAAQAERDAAAAERDRLLRENAVLLHAPKNGARADALLDSTSFMKAFADVDLSDEEAVKAAITNAVEKNSALQAVTLPPTSGSGHQGGGNSKTKLGLQGAVSAAMAS